METKEQRINAIRLQCHEKKFHAFGYSYLYTCRAKIYEKRLQIINYAGLVVPLFIGGYVMTYGTETTKLLLIIGGGILLLQLIFSALALIYKWDEELAYSIESAREHSSLYQDFNELGSRPPSNYDEILSRFSILIERDRSRSMQDLKHDVGEKMKIKGMRWSLREFQRKCVGCDTIPYDMNKTNCPVCGKY